MDKRLLFPQNAERERDVFFLKEDRAYLCKHASGYHPAIQKYIEKAKPIEGLIQVLLTALGAYPYWPQNVNGDRFLEAALAHGGDDYGYKTFATNANYFTHHVNKDPALAKGKVLHSVWNDKGHRVELIIGIDPVLDPDAASEIDGGNPLAFSMGAKLPFDVCTVCGNKARTRAEYCEHLRYQMNQIDPETGILVGALNPQPKFFDISRVLIPADKTAYMWEKIASPASPLSKLGSAFLAELPPGKLADTAYLMKKAEEMNEIAREHKKAAAAVKKANVTKAAEIKKEIPAVGQDIFQARLRKILPFAKHALDASSPDLDFGQMKGYDFNQILMTLAALGILPKQDEAEELIRLFAPSANTGPTLKDFSPELAKLLLPMVPERSFARPHLVRRIVVLIKRDPIELKKVAAGLDEKKRMHPGVAAGIIAALGVLAHYGGLVQLVKAHPFLSMILGAGAIRSIRDLNPDHVSTVGEVSLADPHQSFYNNDWQRRFADMQMRPVTVIKTGADSTTESQQPLGLGGIPLTLALCGISQQPVSQFIEENPSLFESSLNTKTASSVAAQVSELLTSARRFVKTASLEDLDFLSMLPESSRNSVWDLAVLNAASKLEKVK
jgi:hypothetical protein